ncbi:MAG: aldehyde dehydrogenase family protein [Phycisphaerae bacterium]|nr:aldehyde dehydrogenase family protein [Phycisphaerae bacterium]
MSSLKPSPATAVPAADAHLDSIDPATGAVVGRVGVTPADQIGLVTHRARNAARSWGGMTLEERAAILKSAAEQLKDRATEIGTLICREMGKPLTDAIGEATYAASGFSDLVDEAVQALQPEIREDAKTRSMLVFDPLGVCASITPWNFPVLMPQECVVPALVAGNAVILKPSEETPLCAQAWATCLMEVLPPDVLQIVFGDEQQGKALVAGDVDLIAFTGSRSAGQHILAAAGRSLKRVILELGGKDPLIVLPDADIEAAATFAARNSFRNAGQVCVSTERIYVHASIADAFEQKVAEKAAALKQGAGTEEGVTIGPMVHARQKAHVLRQIESAVQQGATVLFGNDPRPGNFVAPTVLVQVSNDMDIMREETFGPVACIVRYDQLDQAIRWANNSPFALGGAVFGKDVAAAEDVARRLHSGMVGINQGCGGAKGTPWVGAKQSGYGYHSGRDGHRQFAQVRVISRAK